MKSVVYSTTQYLPCACSSEPNVILCLSDADLLAPIECPESEASGSFPYTTIVGEITKSYKESNNCGQYVWRYVIRYDEALLADPDTALTSAQVVGIFCQDCLTDWTSEQAGNEVHLINNDDNTLTLVSQHGCEYTFAGQALGNFMRFVSNEAQLIAAEADSVVCTIIVGAPFTLTANITITKQIVFLECGVITTAGFTLTLNGTFTAGNYQVFDTAANEIVWGLNSTNHVLLEWFGAVGDGATDDTAAIQLALDTSVANSVWIPVTPLNNKVYGMASVVNVPSRCTIVSAAGRTSGAEFKALAAIIMFQFPSAAGAERQITMRGGMTINGNSLATACINVGFVSGTVIDGVAFRDATIGIDQSGGGTINLYRRLRFSTTIPTCIKLGGASNFVTITDCMFAASATVHIHTTSTWVGSSLNILTNVFDPLGNCVDTIRIERLDNNTPTLHVNIKDNRFDGGALTMVSHINVGQYCYVNIEGNGLSGSTGFPGMVINGDECALHNNYFSNAGIVLGANSRACVVGYQKWGGGFTTITDAGSRNIISPFQVSGSFIGFPALAKGTTANRPNLLSTAMMGFAYLDTTLDADGKVVFWNGTAWVDATGAVV